MTEISAIWLTLKLAAITTAVLLVLATPLAWWLAHSSSRVRPLIEALTAMPLVMPPTVLGFYLLVFFSPDNALGGSWLALTGTTLAFSFYGLVFASLIYSLPFMVQPLTAAFTQLGRGPMEAAASLGASPMDAWLTTILPMARNGYLTAGVLTFAHTVGEFGIVLMVGGNLAGETRVISIAIYESVETLNYQEAYILSGGLMAFSFVVLLGVYQFNRQFAMSLTPRGMR
ncbi:MAG: molybdate ABC transporter permease subunit [Pseudomonadales bacterium]|nr:molybdate ABC transporter permease subunit [Pseudomonadales bacterium]